MRTAAQIVALETKIRPRTGTWEEPPDADLTLPIYAHSTIESEATVSTGGVGCHALGADTSRMPRSSLASTTR